MPSDLPEPEAVTATLEQIAFIHELSRTYPDVFQPVETAEQARAAFRAGRIGCLIGLEGGHSIAGSLGVLQIMRRLGARYMTLTHNDDTAWADSATGEQQHGGLTDFGRSIVAEMNRLGMLVDLSHVSDNTMHHALDAASAPVIFSHSCCRELSGVSRNVPDSVLERLPANGGVLMIALVPSFLSAARAEWEAELSSRRAESGPETDPGSAAAIGRWLSRNPRPVVSVVDVVDHIDHVREVAGIDAIGIGADYDGCRNMPEGLEDVSCYPSVVAELLRRGYSIGEIGQIVGGNILRVLEASEVISSGPGS